MTSCRDLLVAVALLLVSSTALGKNKETEAASLIERAKQLSDIRAEGAPAFRLRLDFKALKTDGSVIEGKYTEIWLSKTQWRRETVVGDTRRIEIAAGQKRFLLEPVKALPEHIGDLPALLETARFQPEAWKPEKIENLKLNGSNMRCIETKPVDRFGIHVITRPEPEAWLDSPSLCFDRNSGVLAAEIEPSMNRSEDEAYVFSDYQKFEDRTYARSYALSEGGRTRLGARVVEIVTLPKVEPELFALPNGAQELTTCPDPVTPPREVYKVDPGYWGSGTVAISIVVAIDGTPRDLTVVSSSNPKHEKAALEAVRQWRFRPATCDGEPVQLQIAVNIGTH
jgi:TonB family protein